ncbi:DNA mismatch repair endonuclease MutL [Kangiella sediminilitoris]|uniref:DNA mismatch repair protein MutL n=1 Tax=Kangiella sediminilitoris TaxID=1144748 RepID=A0A1B3BCU9_9GAMM|nr:DNA mismatch repair endonuclease MutL [Kangiella sediminilitoris]AOE50622.1 DNA mismatch repair protein MutL [Kangiella sediminilitoris]
MQIKKLSPLLANQIAAGEVVERPSSVVKELLENSIDAGAKRIQIDVDRGGARLIRVTDDGNGIERSQLELALERHATSKIEETKDLKAIYTLGFRGEALASISSVAKLTLSSKSTASDEGDSGWSAIAQGQDTAVDIQPRSMPNGTIVEVRDLFFNTPARQKFLRAERTEYVHIEETIKRVALASPEVAFTLKHNGKVTKRIPAAHSKEQQQQRVGTIVSNNFLSGSIFLDSDIEDLRLWGWISSPERHQNSNLSQYVFVNGRAVRDRTLNHAIRQAYEDLLPTGRVPAYVLYLELDPELVDVNVHPTKHEVRFSDARRVHDFITKTVSEHLQSQEEIYDASELRQVEELKGRYQPKENYSQDEYYHPRLAAGVMQDSRNLSTKALNQAQKGERHYQSFAKKPSAKAGDYLVVGQRYLIQSAGSDMLLLDIKNFMLEHMKQLLSSEWKQGEVKQRPLLIPERLSLPSEQMSESMIEMLDNLGFDVNQTGPYSAALRRVPSAVQQVATGDWLQQIISDAHTNQCGLTELQRNLLSQIEEYWQPAGSENWIELIEPHAWQDSEYCFLLDVDDISRWLMSQEGNKKVGWSKTLDE